MDLISASSVNTSKLTQSQVKFCEGCKKKMKLKNKFCGKCGKEQSDYFNDFEQMD